MTDMDLTDVDTQASDMAMNPAALQVELAAMKLWTMEMFDTTPWGNAARFASRHNGKFLCDVSGKIPRFFIPDALGLWIEDKRSVVMQLCGQIVSEMRTRAITLRAPGAADDSVTAGNRLAAWTDRSESRSAFREMAVLAAERYGMTIIADDHFDQQRDVLPLPDGRLVELMPRGINVRRLKREDMVTATTEGNYRPELLECPPDEVKLYLETFLPDEEFRERLFRVLGACIFGSNKDRLLPIIIGGTTCGKSQLTEGIDAALGFYCKAATASVLRGNLDDKPRPDILRIIRRRIAFLNEASDAWDLHGDRVKDITGGAPLPVRGMRTNDFTDVQPYFTPVIVSNAMPSIKDADLAVKRRMLAFEFTKSFTGPEDTGIKQRFVNSQDVRDYLVTRIIQGYEDCTNKGLQDVIDAQSLETMKAYEGLTNVCEFLEWAMDEKLQPSVDASHTDCVAVGVLHEMYSDWLKRFGDAEDKRRKLKLKAFNAQLRSSGWESHKCGSTNHWVGKVPQSSWRSLST